VLAGRFGARTAALVAAVTNPAWEPGRGKHEQYREHILAALQASPWARVIKASDFTDNAVGIIHTTGPKLPELARKYGPLVPALRVLILRLRDSLPLAGSGPGQRLQNRCSARPGCGIMEAQARAGPGEAGRPLRRLADCKVTCRGIR